MSTTPLAASLEQLADAADRGPSPNVPSLLAACLAACARDTSVSQAQLVDLQQRLTVWRDVWPRLGTDPQFRAAVAREAHRWAASLPRGAQ